MPSVPALVRAVSGRRAKWVVAAVWLAIAVAAGPFAGKLASVQSDEQSSYLPGGAESTQVLRLAQRFQGGDVSQAIAIYRRPSGLTAADRVRVRADRRAAARADLRGVLGVTPVRAAPDGRAALFSVALRKGGGKGHITAAVERLRAIADRGGDSGLAVAVTGPAAFRVDAEDAFSGADATLLFATAALVAVLLLVIYRSPLLWLLPLVSVGVAEVATRAATYGLAKAGLVVNSQTAGILTVLVFGAGTDYALLFVARYREELTRHEDPHAAMAAALRRAGPAILASAGTVICALLCLLAAELNSNSGLGPIAAAGIAIALAAMLTLLPAVLLLAGRRAFWPFVPRFGDDPHEGTGAWQRVGRGIAPRARRVWIGSAAGLAVLAIGLADLHFGLNQLEGFRGTVESVQGQRLLARSFPAGATAPATVIVRDPAQLAGARRAAAATSGVAAVGAVQRTADAARFDVTLAAQPYGDAATDTVRRLRDRLPPSALVGGPTAQTLDANTAAFRDTEVIIPLVLVVVFAILALLLRAVVAPLMLIATVVLSFAASLGLSSVVFDQLFGYPGVDAVVPLIAFIFLVALGVDYNIFLMARVREESAHIGTRDGVLRGLAVTGAVITSAGVVLAGTFAVLAVLPLVVLTEIGFVVAFGVLLDTLLVRSVLVPALSLDIGPRLWWPSALARQEPDAAHEEVAA